MAYRTPFRTLAARPRQLGSSLRSQGRRELCRRPTLEVLEDRTVPAVLTVTTLADLAEADDGHTSLREAIDQANATEAADVIAFAEGLSGTIQLTSNLSPL